LSTELATLKEAAQYLGISRTKMWTLVKEGVILPLTSPLDRRKKLFRRSELKKLKEVGK
jgi:excisionase family DNA binding protein